MPVFKLASGPPPSSHRASPQQDLEELELELEEELLAARDTATLLDALRGPAPASVPRRGGVLGSFRSSDAAARFPRAVAPELF